MYSEHHTCETNENEKTRKTLTRNIHFCEHIIIRGSVAFVDFVFH